MLRRYLLPITATLPMLLFTIGCASAPATSSDRTTITESANPSGASRAVVVIHGMACPFCTYNIQRQLEQIPGVEQVDVSLDRGEAYVTLSERNRPSAAELRQAVESAGFTAAEVRMP